MSLFKPLSLGQFSKINWKQQKTSKNYSKRPYFKFLAEKKRIFIQAIEKAWAVK